MKALVVDDDIRNIFALTTLLERGGLEVISAEGGEEGVAIARADARHRRRARRHHDAGHGRLRDDAGHAHSCRAAGTLPIVALTANVAAGERQRCIDAGASAYVSKPVEAADLLLILSEWLPEQRVRGAERRSRCG